MQFFKDAAGQLYAFEDDVQVTGAPGALIFTGPQGVRLDVPGTLISAPAPAPGAPSAAPVAWQQHQAQAARAVRAAEAIALRCFMAGQAFPAAWQTYALSLRASVAAPSGTPGVLPVAPAEPPGV